MSAFVIRREGENGPLYYGLQSDHDLAPAVEVWTSDIKKAVDFPSKGDAQRFLVFNLDMQGSVVGDE